MMTEEFKSAVREYADELKTGEATFATYKRLHAEMNKLPEGELKMAADFAEAEYRSRGVYSK
jgi:hypothetical protein